MFTEVLVLGAAVSGKLLVAVAVAVAVAALAAAIVTLFSRGEPRVGERIGAYSAEEPDAMAQRSTQQLTESAMVQQAVEYTEILAQRTGVLARTQHALEQADIPLRPAELLFLYGCGLLLLFVAGVVLLSSIGLVLVMTVVAGLVPPAIVVRKRAGRLRAFQAQLPDILNLLAGSLRAGFSFMQGLEAVAEEAAEPMRRELARVVTETRLGREIEDALDDIAVGMESLDLTWAVMAVRIQREVGGNLAELLDTVADTMLQRERLRGEILALTAEGRLSGIVLGVFPFAFAGFLYVIRPEYLKPLFNDTTGIFLTIGSVVLAIAGFVWLRRIMTIEV